MAKFKSHLNGLDLETSLGKFYFEKGHYGPEGPRMLQFSIKFVDHPATWVCLWKWYYQIGFKKKPKKL